MRHARHDIPYVRRGPTASIWKLRFETLHLPVRCSPLGVRYVACCINEIKTESERAVSTWSQSRGEGGEEGGKVEQKKKPNQTRTRSEEKPKEPHGDVRQIVIRRPRIVAYLEPRKRRPVLPKPKRAQPAVQPCILAQLPFVLPVVLQHHHVRRPQHLVHRPHPLVRHPARAPLPIFTTLPLPQRTDRAADSRTQPRQLHTPPPQFRREFPGRARAGAQPAHERGGVEFGGEDARVEVRVRRAPEGRVQAAVDEQERRQLKRWAEWVARHRVERDVLEDFLWDRIKRNGHDSGLRC